MSSTIQPELTLIESGEAYEFDEEADLLDTLHQAWLVRTGGDPSVIENDINNLLTDINIEISETYLGLAATYSDGFITETAQEKLGEIKDELAVFEIGRQAVQSLFREKVEKSEEISIDEIQEELSITYDEYSESQTEVVKPKNGLKDHILGADERSAIAHLLNHQILSKKEQMRLATLASQGDKNAKDKLIRHNIKFVALMAGRKINKGVEFVELLQEGVFGLSRAIEKFDPSKGFTFLTYAEPWINRFMQAAIARQGLAIRLPEREVAKLVKINKANNNSLQETGHPLTPEELSSETGISLENIRFIRRAVQPIKSLDEPVAEEDGYTLVDKLQGLGNDTETTAINNVFFSWINERVGELDPRQAFIVRLRSGVINGREYNFKEIGTILGISGERSKQLYNLAIEQLQELAIDRTPDLSRD